MGKIFMNALDAQIRATAVLREKGGDEFCEKIKKDMTTAINNGESHVYVHYGDRPQLIVVMAMEALAEAGYTVHNEYSSKSIDIIWGYVDVMKKEEM